MTTSDDNIILKNAGLLSRTRRLNALWHALNAASSIRELAQRSKTYTFPITQSTVTFFLQTENAAIHVRRWARPLVEVTVKLRAPFGWRVVTDQDEAGVYIAAKRRPVVGSFSKAIFAVTLPEMAFLTLNLNECLLTLDDLNGTLHLPPTQALHGQRPLPLKSI
jgi:hypothetical protein